MLHNAKIVGFVEGTHVLMADGNWKTIESIKEGEMVMSFESDRDNGELHPRKVVGTWNGIVRDCIEVHNHSKVTIVAKDQLFFTPGAAWSQSFNTKQVLDYAGTPMSIQTRNVRGGKHKLYDITVDKTHSFIANDMRVHNGGGGGGGTKQKVAPPQPVVTAGKPGMPVSVTTTYKGNTTTVVVNPSPGSSGQVSVGARGTIRTTQIGTPSLGNDNTVMPRVLPYPAYYQYSDRVSNAEAIRAGVCGDILSKGDDYRIRASDAASWSAQIDSLLDSLNAIKKDRGYKYRPMARGNSHSIWQDPSAINDAISEMQSLKADLKAGKKLKYNNAVQSCARTEEIIGRLAYMSDPGGGPCDMRNRGPYDAYPLFCEPQIKLPIAHCECPEKPVCPAPENYFSDRIYEDNANFSYYTKVNCTYYYNPPNVPANLSVKYYKHWDPATNRNYYDRISSGSYCESPIGTTMA